MGSHPDQIDARIRGVAYDFRGRIPFQQHVPHRNPGIDRSNLLELFAPVLLGVPAPARCRGFGQTRRIHVEDSKRGAMFLGQGHGMEIGLVRIG